MQKRGPRFLVLFYFIGTLVNGNIEGVNEFVRESVLSDNMIIFDQGSLCTNMPHLTNWIHFKFLLN